MKVQNSILLLLILSTISLIGCKDDEVKPNQLLLNTDVEEGSRDPEHWWLDRAPQSNVNWSTVEAFSGEKSLHIERETSDSLNFSFWAQTVNSNIPVGKSVSLQAKIKGKLIGDGVSLFIRGDNSSQANGYAEQYNTTQGNISITGDFDWENYNVKLENIEPEIKSLTVYLIFNQNTKGDVYFDDITLTYD